MVWGLSSGSWAAEPSSEVVQAAPVVPEGEAELRASAVAQHAEATRSRSLDAFAQADQAYREYLGLGPDADGAYEMQYRHGTLLSEYAEQLHASDEPETQARGVELFRSAHDAFVRVLEMSATGTRHGEAAYAQMATLRSHLEYAQAGPTRRSCRLNTKGVCVYRAKRKVKKRRDPTEASSRLAAKPYADREIMMFEAYTRFEEHVDVAVDAGQKARGSARERSPGRDGADVSRSPTLGWRNAENLMGDQRSR